MPSAPTIIFYCFTFLSMYVQVFLLITFFEKRKHIKYQTETITRKHWPTATVVVPCWNEERTIAKTVQSLLSVDYPKHRLAIFLIDNGSTDSTWRIMKRFEKYPQVKIFQEATQGKHYAMNLGITKATSTYVGCLDADSFVHPQALKRIMTYFDNQEVMAVSPSVIVNNPVSFIQRAQKVEYEMSVYIKKVLGLIGAIHVTPGPFSIYRRKVFIDLGLYRKAHNTEDMEIAYRMQKHHYRIEQCQDAYVYTETPKTIRKLYKQRLRWIYGFINNTLDYRSLLFRPKYGDFSFFTVPSGIASTVAVPFLIGYTLWQIGSFFATKVQAVIDSNGAVLAHPGDFSWFYISIGTPLLLTFFLYAFVTAAIFMGQRIRERKPTFSWNILSFIFIYSIISPVWLIAAIYNTIFTRKAAWR